MPFLCLHPLYLFRIQTFSQLTLCSISHQLLFGTLRTNDIGGIGDKSAADQRRLAAGAAEAIIVPVAVLERDETRSTDACM